MTACRPSLLATSAAAEPSTLLADVLDTACVLIVDDEPTNIALLERVLRSVGVPEIHGVTDPWEAVQRCQDVGADLILLDLHMPGHDGFAVMAELERSLPSDTFLPVLVLTADGTPATRDRALHAGASDFLTKPLDRLETILRVRNLLQTRALYVDLQARNAHLTAQLERQQAHERQLEEEHRARVARIDHVLTQQAFTMVFQPVVDLATGTTVGAEALARFTAHPHRPPNEWFDEAARVRRGIDLEVAAVTAALQELHRLPGEAFLAVNVAPETATSPELTDALQGVAPARVMLELTEHSQIEDYHQLLTGLQPLRDRGFRIAVDDAGSGYAGLRHVLQLRPDVLKLDIDLISSIDQDPAKRALGTALVAFAHDTGATIVAEGIETAAELETLRALGVSWGQGYYLARPAALPLPPTVRDWASDTTPPR